MCEPESRHNGGESGRRGKPRVPPAPGSPDQWIGLPRGLQGLLEKAALSGKGIGRDLETALAKLTPKAERTAGLNATSKGTLNRCVSLLEKLNMISHL